MRKISTETIVSASFENGQAMQFGKSLRRAALLGTALVAVSALPAYAQDTTGTATPAQAEAAPAAAPAPAQTEAAPAAAPAAPTSGLDEIVVTAERRMGSLQSVASSVSVRQGTQLQKEGKFNLRQLLEDVPGVSGGADSGAAGAGTDTPGTGVTIRGIGSNAPLGGSLNSTVPATAIYTDDISGGIGGAYDIARIEVLRGPQGTLYGRSATAGVVAIHTRDPNTDRFGLNIAQEAGTAGLMHLSGGVNVPISDKLAIRASGNYYTRDGYYAKEGDAIDTIEGRIKVLYKPTENLSLLVGAAFQNNKTRTGEINGTVETPNTLTYSDVPVGKAKNQSRMYWAELNWDLGPVAVTYIPALRTYTQSGVAYTQGGQLLRQTMETPHDHFITQELRLASSTDSKLKWQAGGFFYRNSLRNHNLVENQDPFNTDVYSLSYESTLYKKVTTDIGVFAEATYSFSDSTRLTGGIRYDRTKITTDQDYTSTVVDNSTSPPTTSVVTLQVRPEDSARKFNNVTYKARLEHDFSPENLVYASVSTGFLPGDINVTSGSTGPYVSDFSTETLTAYEIGTKNRFFDNKLQLNAAGFYYRYGGYQVGGINVGGSGGALNLVTLSSKAEVKGAELEVAFRATPNDRFGLNLTYTDARFKDKTAEFAESVAQDKIANVSPFVANASYIRHFDVNDNTAFEVGVDGIYRSGYDFAYVSQTDVDNGLKPLVHVGGQFVANAHATLTFSDRYSLTAYVRNIADKRYISTGSVVAGAGSVGTTPSNIVIARYADPRTFGVVLTADF